MRRRMFEAPATESDALRNLVAAHVHRALAKRYVHRGLSGGHTIRFSPYSSWFGRSTPQASQNFYRMGRNYMTGQRVSSWFQSGYGMGSTDSDLQRLAKLKADIQMFRNELRMYIGSGTRKSTVDDNAKVYADVMDGMLKQFDRQLPDAQLRAGGDQAKEAIKFMNSYDTLLASRKAMWAADLKDASGAASMAIAKKAHDDALVNSASAAENVQFWEKVTNIDNPFSPVSIFSSLKGYAIWGLVIGGLVLATPILIPMVKSIGGAISDARARSAARRAPPPPPPAPTPVAANSRRRRSRRRR